MAPAPPPGCAYELAATITALNATQPVRAAFTLLTNIPSALKPPGTPYRKGSIICPSRANSEVETNSEKTRIILM